MKSVTKTFSNITAAQTLSLGVDSELAFRWYALTLTITNNSGSGSSTYLYYKHSFSDANSTLGTMSQTITEDVRYHTTYSDYETRISFDMTTNKITFTSIGEDGFCKCSVKLVIYYFD